MVDRERAARIIATNFAVAEFSVPACRIVVKDISYVYQSKLCYESYSVNVDITLSDGLYVPHQLCVNAHTGEVTLIY